MEDISVKKFKSFELSRETLEEILRNIKLDNVLSKYGLTSIKSDDEIWELSSFMINNSILKKSIIDCYLKVMNQDCISREDTMVLKSKTELVKQLYKRRRSPKRIGVKSFSAILNSYQQINLSKSDIELIEKSVRACVKYYPNIKNIDEIVDALIIITVNRQAIKSLFSEVFNLLCNLEDFKEEYKSLIKMKKILFSIPKDTDVFDKPDLTLILKYDALIRKYGKFKPEVTMEYVSKLYKIANSEHNIEALFNMLIYTDFENKSCNIGEALEHCKPIIEKPNCYILEEIDMYNKGYNILDFIKEASQNLYNIKISVANTKGDCVRNIYNLLGKDCICDIYWYFKVDGNDLAEEARYNIDVLEDAYCYYYYGQGVYLYEKRDKLDQIETDNLEKNINYIKRAIDRQYISLTKIYYSSKEIDSFINNNENLEPLKDSINKINIILAKNTANISETVIIEKGSPLFPEECENQYVLLSVCSQVGRQIATTSDELVEDTCINYLDIDNNRDLNEETKKIISLLKNITS